MENGNRPTGFWAGLFRIIRAVLLVFVWVIVILGVMTKEKR